MVNGISLSSVTGSINSRIKFDIMFKQLLQRHELPLGHVEAGVINVKLNLDL